VKYLLIIATFCFAVPLLTKRTLIGGHSQISSTALRSSSCSLIRGTGVATESIGPELCFTIHLKPAAKKLGLSGVTWHLLRHSHATMLDVVSNAEVSETVH
jgi:hypothetical protein